MRLGSFRMSFISKLYMVFKNNTVIFIVATLFLILPLAAFALFTTVETGTRAICSYGHTIKDDSKTIIVFRWNASKYGVSTGRTVCGPHRDIKTLEAKIDDAKKRMDSKQVKALTKLLESTRIAVTRVNNYTETDGNIGGKGNSERYYSGDLISLIPNEINGYKMLSQSPGAITASRTYEPVAKGNSNIQMMTIALNQQNNEDDAIKSIDETIKTYYAANGTDTMVNNAKAYFGTDDQDHAILTYQINGVVFSIEMTVKTGSPGSLLGVIKEVGRYVP
jgi:hypothetical protein